MNTKLIMTMVLALVMQIMTAQQRQVKKERIISELNLTEQQQVELDKINTEGNSEIKEIMVNDEISADQKKELISRIRKENRTKRNQVLTAEQQEIKKEKLEKRKAMKQDRRKALKTARMQLNESLTDYELLELQAIQEKLNIDREKHVKRKRMMPKDQDVMKMREEKRESFKAQHEQEFSYLEALATKYSVEIDDLMQSTRPKKMNDNIQHAKPRSLKKPDAEQMTHRRIKFLLIK